MRKDLTVTAEPRLGRGKNEARRLRVKGLAPAIVYGAEKEPVAVAVSPKEINRILLSNTGHNTIFNMTITMGETTPVMIVDWQHDPVKEHLLHVDLKRIDPAKRILVKVAVHPKGDAKGVKLQGGLLELVTREVEVECLPDDIPEGFDIDVADLELNQGVRAGQLPMSKSMKLISPADTVIVHVIALKAEVVATPDATAAATPAEPEVAKKGKKEEEGAAPAAGGDKKKK
jgi:large subunit ribosomal protein L25